MKSSNLTIDILIREYKIPDIEKHLIYHFAQYNQLRIEQNDFMTLYFKNFSVNHALLQKIKILNHIKLDQITDDMGILMSPKDKQLNGAFFTPKYIVDFIIETVAPNKNSLCADISCGAGAFIIGLLRYFTEKLNVTAKECLENNIVGGDILDYNVNRCRLLVILFGLLRGENLSENLINVTVGDSLKKDWGNKFDVIVGNPPYVKFQDLDENTRTYLFNNYDTTKLGTYNLYFAFFEVGVKLLKDDGRLGYITPNNYFTSLSGEPLRVYFQHKQNIYKIIDFSSKKVFDVQTYTAITFLDKKKNESIEYDRIDDDEMPWEFLKEISTTHNSYTDLNVKKWRLLCGKEREYIYLIENSGRSLNDLFDICVGIATLKDDAYTFIPSKEDNEYYYIEIGNKTYPIEKASTRPLVKISENKCQKDLENNRKRIVFPYTFDSALKPQIMSEEEFKEHYPMCYEYMLTKRGVLENRGKGNHKYTPFFKYGRVQSLNKFGIKILTPTFSQYPRFIIDNTTNGLFTNGYGIYPRKEQLNVLFGNDPIQNEENFDVLQKILNSIIMHYYVKKTSVSIEGGYPCYQKNFIERFTIPELSETEIECMRNMSNEEVDSFLMEKYHVNLPEPKRCW